MIVRQRGELICKLPVAFLPFDRLRLVLPHPFRKQREKDGAPGARQTEGGKLEIGI